MSAAIAPELLLWTARNITVAHAEELRATREAGRYLALIARAAGALEALLQAQRVADAAPAIDPAPCAEAQDTALRALLDDLAAVEWDPTVDAAARHAAATLRKAVTPRSLSPRRPFAVRATEGAQARAALAALNPAVECLPSRGGRSATDRLAAWLEACDACTAAVTALAAQRAARPSALALLLARRDLLDLFGALRTALAGEARVNLEVSPTLDRRLFALVRDARTSKAAPAAARGVSRAA